MRPARGRVVVFERRTETGHGVGFVGAGNLRQLELDDAEVAFGNLGPAAADNGQKRKKGKAKSHNRLPY
jgi:hypothetical protein